LERKNETRRFSHNYNKCVFLRDFDRFAKKFGRKALRGHFNEETTEKIIYASRKELENLSPQLPYIGGNSNIWTHDLIMSAWGLSLYRTLKCMGKTTEEIGQILSEIVDLQLYSYPKFARRLVGGYFFSWYHLRKVRKEAILSHKRLFPGDWVFTYLSKTDDKFDFGYDVTECGLCKFFSGEGALEILPYLCKIEFQKSQAFGLGLTLTTTLAQGQNRCDFRYKHQNIRPS
jgi:hypothetical protein